MAKPEVKADLSGKWCVVTGANTGMGKVTAEALARMGATVVLACRSEERGEEAKRAIAAAANSDKVIVIKLDVSSIASVRTFAEELGKRTKSLDVLVNNAGFWCEDERKSVDGIELQWATNVLGPHLLTELLLPLLEASGHGRIVNVASTAAGGLNLDDVEMSKKYNGFKCYSTTKQADRMLTWAIAAKCKDQHVTANALSPGLVATELNRNVGAFFKVFFFLTKPMARTAADGADTTIWLAASPEAEGLTNKFFVDRKEKPCKFRDPAAIAKLVKIVDEQSRRVPSTQKQKNGKGSSAQVEGSA